MLSMPAINVPAWDCIYLSGGQEKHLPCKSISADHITLAPDLIIEREEREIIHLVASVSPPTDAITMPHGIQSKILCVCQ